MAGMVGYDLVRSGGVRHGRYGLVGLGMAGTVRFGEVR